MINFVIRVFTFDTLVESKHSGGVEGHWICDL